MPASPIWAMRYRAALGFPPIAGRNAGKVVRNGPVLTESAISPNSSKPAGRHPVLGGACRASTRRTAEGVHTLPGVALIRLEVSSAIIWPTLRPRAYISTMSGITRIANASTRSRCASRSAADFWAMVTPLSSRAGRAALCWCQRPVLSPLCWCETTHVPARGFISHPARQSYCGVCDNGHSAVIMTDHVRMASRSEADGRVCMGPEPSTAPRAGAPDNRRACNAGGLVIAGLKWTAPGARPHGASGGPGV